MTSADDGLRRMIVVLRRMISRTLTDDVPFVASGVSFFVCLAIFPGLAATVILFQMLANASRIERLISRLTAVLPDDAVTILTQQVMRIAQLSATEAGPGASASVLGYGLLLWSASRGTNAVLRGLNRIYDQDETRSFFELLLATVALTTGLILFLVLSLVTVIVLPLSLRLVGLDPGLMGWLSVLRWPFLLVLLGGALAILYRYGTKRAKGTWRSAAFGGGFAALLWVGSSWIFSWYISTFNLPFFYGSMTTIIGFLLWIWISVGALLLGAELDAAMS
jgi:membrane protein